MPQFDNRRYFTNFRQVEIEICTTCNLRCANCDRSSAQAPSTEYMDIEQIEKFISQSIALEWRWDRITLIGGEPTLHPQFEKVIDALERYKSASPSTTFWLYSNGFGTRVVRALEKVPTWIEVWNTHKTKSSPSFSTYNVAPRDLPEYAEADFSKGCSITEHCGLGLTRYGFYPCGAGASIDRVFGFDIGAKDLHDLTLDRVAAMLPKLCALCGHFKDFDDKLKESTSGDPSENKVWVNTQQTSKSWQVAYTSYARSRPDLRKF